MTLPRHSAPALAFLAGAAVATLRARRTDRRRSVVAEESRGCTPDQTSYIDAPLVIGHVNGTHIGTALSMMRDRVSDDTTVLPIDLDYGDTLRSCIETAFALAIHNVEVTFHGQNNGVCEDCEDPECDGGRLSPEHHMLLAGQHMTAIAYQFDSENDEHNEECIECTIAGVDSPRALRTRFARDLATHLLLSPFDTDVELHGVPMTAALDVLNLLMVANVEDIDQSMEEQIEVLAQRLVRALAAQESA